jgi:hypothetical protein
MTDMLENISKKLTPKENFNSLLTRVPEAADQTEDLSSRPTTLQIALWGLLVVLALALAVKSYGTFQIGIYSDDALYVVQAQGLVRGVSENFHNLPDIPQENQFPMGFPLLLAPIALLFPNAPQAMKLVPLLATMINAAILFWGWRWFARHRSYGNGLLVTGLYILAPLTIDHTGMVMSEPVFLMFVLLSILLAERAVQGLPVSGWKILLSVSLAMSFFTRTVGVVVIISVFTYMLWKTAGKIWKQLVQVSMLMVIFTLLITSLTPIGLSNLIPAKYLQIGPVMRFINTAAQALPGTETNPTTPLASTPLEGQIATGRETSAPQSFFRNMVFSGIKFHLGKDMRKVVLPFGSEKGQQIGDLIGLPDLTLYVGFLISAVIILGAVSLFIRRQVTLFMFFAILYFGMLMLWIWNEPRLLYPIQPQIQFSFLVGLESMILWLGSRFKRTNPQLLANSIAISVALLLMGMAAFKSATIQDSRLYTGDLHARTVWLAENSRPEDVILTEIPEVVYLQTGRTTVALPYGKFSAQGLDSYLKDQGITYLLFSANIMWQPSYAPEYSKKALQIMPVVEQLRAQGGLTLVHSSPPNLVKVYRTRY